jgi:membrane-bound lytic murein transglycosylase D
MRNFTGLIFIVFFMFLPPVLSQNTRQKPVFTEQTDTLNLVPPDYEKAVEDMMNDWLMSRMIIQKCYRESAEPVLYDDSVYIKRLQQLPYRIEMPYNSIVRAFIDRYAKSIRQVEYMAGLGQHYYFPIFEHALAKYDLPLELKYLPIIESALNSRAISRAGAGGLWQFMVATGRIYNLEVNSLVDDRFDPVKASNAAARYLKDLYNIYYDWHLVIAAYNCGPGNVARAIRQAGGKTGYWEIYQYLPRETRGYVPIFIAANYIMNFYQEHNMCPATPPFVQVTDTVKVEKRIHLEQITSVLNVPLEELRFLNPQYRQDIIPGNIKPCSLVLPMGKISSFSNNLDSIVAFRANELTAKQVTIEPSNYAKSEGSTVYYKVRSGDSLLKIARKYGTTVSKIKKWNGLKKDYLYAGQKLKIYR